VIPKVIYLCHKELNSLRKSYDHNSLMNPEYKIELYDDTRCKDFLLNEFSKLHCDIFDFLKDGPIKCDFWRLCVLYKYGGVYIDADIELLEPLNSFLESDVELCVPRFDRKDWNEGPLKYIFTHDSLYTKEIKDDDEIYNPQFIASLSDNIIIEKCIDEYVNLYNNKIPYNKNYYSIVQIFTYVMSQNTIPKKYQFIINKWGETYSRRGWPKWAFEHCLYKNKKVLNNRTLASNDS